MSKDSKPRPFLLPFTTLCLLLLLLILDTHFTKANGVSVDAFMSSASSSSSKNNNNVVEDESIMESDISRRFLMMQKRYISYETLRRDMVPCETAGASYYACHAGTAGVANPYNRGCEIITRCARG